jgi:hypothetical protein
MGTGLRGNHCLDKAGLSDSTYIPESCLVQFTTFIMNRFHSSMLSGYGMVSRNQKGLNLQQNLKVHGHNHPT